MQGAQSDGGSLEEAQGPRGRGKGRRGEGRSHTPWSVGQQQPNQEKLESTASSDQPKELSHVQEKRGILGWGTQVELTEPGR